MTITKLRSLEQLAHSLATAPDWQTIRKLLNTNTQRITRRNIAEWAGRAMETHVGLILEEIGRDIEGITAYSQLPSKDTENYTFYNNRNGQTQIIDRHTEKHIGDVDGLFTINEPLAEPMPVLLEVKSGNPEKRNGAYQEMRPERIAAKTAPIKEYFNTNNCGYIIVMPSDKVTTRSSVQRGFRELQGLIAPIYASQKQLREEAEIYLG